MNRLIFFACSLELMTACDVETIVIGAGPGGSAAAIELARAGRDVLLIEKKTFPRGKVCGGCISGAGAQCLRHLIRDRDLPGIDGRRVTFTIGNYRATHVPRPNETRMVVRSEMDALLASIAAEEGAEVRFDTHARLQRDGQRWLVRVDDRMIAARFVLLAGGLSFLPPQLGIENGGRRRRLISQQWMMPADGQLPGFGEVELHWMRGGYVGLATPEPGQCVVALAARPPTETGLTALEVLQQQNPHHRLWQSISTDAANEFAAKGCGGFPWRPTRLGDRNLLLVGDAAGYEEPYSGEGIGQALYSGICAARSILEHSPNRQRALASYSQRIGRYHRRVCRRTSLVSRMLNNRLLLGFSELPPMLPASWLSQIVSWMHVQPPRGMNLESPRPTTDMCVR